MNALATIILIVLLLVASLTLLAVVVGLLFMPRPEWRSDAFLDQPAQPWAATRCGFEDLRNCVSRELPSGEARPAAGRMYAMPPAAIDPPGARFRQWMERRS